MLTLRDIEREKIERLRQWSKGIAQPPIGIELAPTLRCNLGCRFCWRIDSESHNKREMDFNVYESIIEQAARLNVREVKIIGGGEPTLHPDIIHIMKLVKLYGMYGYICTNGTLFDENSVRELVESGFDHVKISFHSPEKLVEDRITCKKGSFDKQLRSFRLFRRYKDKLKRNNPYIEIGMVLGKNNSGHIKGMVELAHEIGVDGLFIEPVTVYTDVGRKMKLDREEQEKLLPLIKQSKRLADNYNIETNLGFIQSEIIDKTNRMDNIILNQGRAEKKKSTKKNFLSLPCYEPFLRMGIRVDGQVCPCGFLDEASSENVMEKELKGIWFGSYFEKLRENMIRRKLLPQCSRCCTTLVMNNLNIRKELMRLMGD